MRHSTWIIVLLLGLSACTQALDLDSAEARRTFKADDPFRPVREVSGMPVRTGVHPNVRELVLYAGQDRTTGVWTTYARLSVSYLERLSRTIEEVRNARAEKLEFKLISHEGAGCRRAEGCQHLLQLAVKIPEAELRAARQTGYQLKVFTRSGEAVHFVAPAQIVAALLAAMDAVEPLPSAAAGKT